MKKEAQMPRNPVAKNMNKFNKPATHKDKKNDYQRTPKHRSRGFSLPETLDKPANDLTL